MRKLPLLTLLVLGCASSLPASAQTVLRVSNWLPPTHLITTEILQPWARNVEKETEGRVKVQIIPALGKPEAHFDLVRKGVADVAMSVDAYTADRFKLPDAAKLPFLSDDATSTTVAYWRIHQKHFAKHGEFDGVKLLTLWTHGPGYLHTSTKPVRALGDASGLKIRASGGMGQKIAVALGVSPVFAPASQAYEMLSNGVVDGVLFNNQSIPAFKIDKILKYALVVPGGLYRDTHYVIMNQKKYDSLSAEDRAAIDRVSGETFAWLAGRAWDAGEQSASKVMRDSGYEFISPSPEFAKQLADRLNPLEQEWIERVRPMGIDGKAVLVELRAEIEKVRAENAKK
ncbi:MAG: TRAP transporter substrate-binding protein [Burkholderiaceae bacterium]|nr:TRAP transporter substrate-binding protein [Burkholderiaceae bacterium]